MRRGDLKYGVVVPSPILRKIQTFIQKIKKKFKLFQYL